MNLFVNKYLFHLYILLILIVSSVSIYSYPGWFDEVFFSDIIYNLSKYSQLNQNVYIIPDNKIILLYGPVYFYLNKFFINLFDYNYIIIRVISGIPVFFIAIILFNVLKHLIKNVNLSKLFVLIYLLDPSIIRAVSLGRMDIMASFFSLLSFYIVLKNENLNIKCLILSSLFASIAYLTTPRALFILIPTFLQLFNFIYIEFTKKSNILYFKAAKIIFVYSLCFFLPIFFWISNVGDVQVYINLFASSKSIQKHIGISVIRREIDVLLFAILLIYFSVSYKLIFKSVTIFSIIITIFTFSIFVKEQGPYHIMILPYFYVLFAMIFNYVYTNKLLNIKLLLSPILLLIFLFTLILVYKSIDVLWVNFECRNNKQIEQFVKSHIPEKSFVAGDYEYYYILNQASDKFVQINSILENSEKINFIPEYIIISNCYTDNLEQKYPGIFKKFRSQYVFEARYSCNINDLGMPSFLRSRRNYNGTTIFKRVDN